MKKVLFAAAAVISLGSAAQAGQFLCSPTLGGSVSCSSNRMGVIYHQPDPALGQAVGALGGMLLQMAQERAYQRALEEAYAQPQQPQWSRAEIDAANARSQQAVEQAIYDNQYARLPCYSKPAKQKKHASRQPARKKTARFLTAEENLCISNGELPRCRQLAKENRR